MAGAIGRDGIAVAIYWFSSISLFGRAVLIIMHKQHNFCTLANACLISSICVLSRGVRPSHVNKFMIVCMVS